MSAVSIACLRARMERGRGRRGLSAAGGGAFLPRKKIFSVYASGMQFLLAGILLCLLLAVPASGAARYERLRPGDCFAVLFGQDGLRYEARLRLFARHFFVLSESFFWKEKPPLRRAVSGLWFQLQGGSLLWLHNPYGLSRPLNVGGKGSLYADMPLPGGRGSLSVVFHPAAVAEEPLRLMGTMRAANGRRIFVESASGLEFSLAGNLPAEARADAAPLFLELDARLAGETLTVDKVCASSRRLPSAPAAGPRTLAEVLAGPPWRLELPDGQEFSVSFSPATGALPPDGSADKDEEKGAAVAAGNLDLAAPGVYLSLPLFAEGQTLRLVLGHDERAMLLALGQDALLATLDAVRRWDIHGALLVLYDEKGPCCTLLQQGRTL